MSVSSFYRIGLLVFIAALAFLPQGLPLHAQADVRLSSELIKRVSGGDSNVWQRNPMIIGRKGEAIAFAYEHAGIGTPDILAAWNPGSSDTAAVIDAKDGNMQVQDGSAFTVRMLDQYSEWVQIPGHSMVPVFSYMFGIMLPTPEHWVRSLSSNYQQDQSVAGAVSPSFDHKHTLVLFSGQDSWRSVGSFDQDGGAEWTATYGDLPTGRYDHLISLSGQRFALVSAGTIAVFETNRMLSQKQLPDVNQRDQYWPLPGSRFLRTRPAGGGFSMVLYDSTATSLDSLFLTSAENISTVSVSENTPGGEIVIAAATNRGVRGFSVRDSLTRLFASNSNGFRDVLLSATSDSVTHPSLFLSNDSLFVIWEDYRNGPSDIYGTIRLIPEKTMEGPDAVTVAVYPNPATDRISIEIGSNQGGDNLSVDLVDIAGNRLLHGTMSLLSPGVYEYNLDVSGIAAGSYFVAVTGSQGKKAVPVAVLHR